MLTFNRTAAAAACVLLLLTGCADDSVPTNKTDNDKIHWQVTQSGLKIKLDYKNNKADEYYATIRNEEGRKFSVNLGMPDDKGIFIIPNCYGRIAEIEITSNPGY